MENFDYKKFNESFDVEGLKKDIAAAKDGNNTYEDLPVDDYEVAVEKLELKANKDGKPMLSVWFKILVGNYEGRLMFLNQMLTSGFGIHKANEFLNSLESGLEVSFEDFGQYGALIDSVKDAITGKHEYLVEYSKTVSKGNTYNQYKIKKVYDL
jgi:hypothetical protein